MSYIRRAKRELQLLWRDPLLAFLVGIVAFALILFVLFPLISVLIRSFQTQEGAFSLVNYRRFFTFRYLRSALSNSLFVGIATGVAGQRI